MSTSPDGINWPPPEIVACPLCDENGYLPSGAGLVCDHTDHTETNRRGMVLVRKALAGKPNDPSVLHRKRMADQICADTDPEPDLDDDNCRETRQSP